MNITKNQHYVPEKYLKEWISKDGTISINNNGKVICAKSVYYYAQENFFYKYEKLNYHEFCILIDYIKKNALIPHNDLQVYLTSCYTPVIYETIDNDELNDDFNRIMLKIIEEKLFDAQSIKLIHMYIKFKKMIETIGKDEVEEEIDRMKKEIKNETNEGFERFYSNIESNAWPYLNKALGGDISFFYSEDGFDYVIFFLMHQFVRTKRFVQYIHNIINNGYEVDSVSRIYSYLRYPLARQFHKSILKERKEFEIKLIKNSTELEFITGDHPLVNLDLSIPPCFWDLYYPISPDKALFISTKERIKTKYNIFDALTSQDVNYLNREICSVCSKQVYASNMDTLVRYGYYAGLSQA